MSFGERLRAAREIRKLTQAELGERTGLQPSAVAHFEANRRKPSFENMRSLAKALDVTTDYLAGGMLATTAFRDEDKLSDADRKLIQGMIDVMVNQKKE